MNNLYHYLFAAIRNFLRRPRNFGEDRQALDDKRGCASRPPDVAGGLRDRQKAGRQQQQHQQQQQKQQQQQQHLPAGNH